MDYLSGYDRKLLAWNYVKVIISALRIFSKGVRQVIRVFSKSVKQAVESP